MSIRCWFGHRWIYQKESMLTRRGPNRWCLRCNKYEECVDGRRWESKRTTAPAETDYESEMGRFD